MSNISNFFNGVKNETPKPQLAQDVHPFALRDQTNPICANCKKPTKQNYIVASRRGNFRHGGTTVKMRPIGAVCVCDE